MRRSAVFKHLVWLVTAALIAQSWFTLIATSAVTADSDAIVICTGSGFKVISLPDGMGPPADSSENSHEHGEHHLDCAACLVHAVGKTIGDGAFGATSIVWPAVIFDAAFERQPAPSPQLGAHRTRGPPVG